MGSTKSRKLEQDALRHCLTAVFGWEGGLPDRTLCNFDVLQALAGHYAAVLDNASTAGTLKDPDLIRLAEFLTEPSVQSLKSMVAAIPQHSRTFRQLLEKPAGSAQHDEIKPSLSTSGDEPSAPVGPAGGPAGRGPTAEEIVEFLRQHQDRVVVVMLSRGGGFTHSQIAKTFGISRSRCYRYEKWFEGLAESYRHAIISVGLAARKKHKSSDRAFDITSRLIASTEVMAIVAVDNLLEDDAEYFPAKFGAAPSGHRDETPGREPAAIVSKSPLHGFLAGVRAKLGRWAS